MIIKYKSDENDECCMCMWNKADTRRKNSKGREGIMQYGKSTVFMQFSVTGKRQEAINAIGKISSGD